ncbi:N-formylglutamate amidohydrolase [Prescottella subtropica]|uniref:N-formylglutamate amidohydrolase n=1 Tax=Prescottella subtropica TaxID=2545757 RepID=UPI001F4F7A9F|nr:N-formylglutamate amidohydrolase [Prescottella subtropica]
MPGTTVITPADQESPVVVHVPHSSRTIPPQIRADLLLDDAALAAELDEATDTATADIAAAALAHVRYRPTLVVNPFSRLVVDPERFPDDTQEPAAAFGRGAVYTRTCGGAPLRAEPYPQAGALLESYFRPHADAVTDAVAGRLAACGRAVVIDLHSYPVLPSGFEDPAAARPALCVGTDPVHTPDWLETAARGSFASLGETGINTPYAGTYVPLRWYGQDRRVSSVMIELRRDTYLTDPRTPDPARVEELGRALATLVDTITDRVC